MGGAIIVFALRFFLESKKKKANIPRKNSLLCACVTTLTTDIHTYRREKHIGIEVVDEFEMPFDFWQEFPLNAVLFLVPGVE